MRERAREGHRETERERERDRDRVQGSKVGTVFVNAKEKKNSHHQFAGILKHYAQQLTEKTTKRMSLGAKLGHQMVHNNGNVISFNEICSLDLQVSTHHQSPSVNSQGHMLVFICLSLFPILF